MTAPEAQPYSRAFESFVENPDDVVGLLAYALYKQNIQDARRAGRDATAPAARVPGLTEVKAFRGYAERALQTVIERATEADAAQWLATGREQGRLADKNEILSQIRARTSFSSAVIVGGDSRDRRMGVVHRGHLARRLCLAGLDSKPG